MKRYHYTECGLDNVIIEGVDFVIDDNGDEVICIPAINKLHRAIAESIIRRPSAMSGKELRFLRTEMGMTQAQLAKLLHRDAQSIARWEKGEVELDGNAETVVRLLAREKLGLDIPDDVSSIAQRSTPVAGSREILISGNERGEYHPLAA